MKTWKRIRLPLLLLALVLASGRQPGLAGNSAGGHRTLTPEFPEAGRYVSRNRVPAGDLARALISHLEKAEAGSLEPSDGFLHRNPLLARLCLYAYRGGAGLEFLQKAYPLLSYSLEDRFRNLDENGNGFLELEVGETTFGSIRRNESLRLSSFAADEMRCLAEIAALIGKPDDGIDWEYRFRSYRSQIGLFFFDLESNSYFDRSALVFPPVAAAPADPALALWLGFDLGPIRTRLVLQSMEGRSLGAVPAPFAGEHHRDGSIWSSVHGQEDALLDALIYLRAVERMAPGEDSTPRRRSILRDLQTKVNSLSASPWSGALIGMILEFPEEKEDPLFVTKAMVSLLVQTGFFDRDRAGLWSTAISDLEELSVVPEAFPELASTYQAMMSDLSQLKTENQIFNRGTLSQKASRLILPWNKLSRGQARLLGQILPLVSLELSGLRARASESAAASAGLIAEIVLKRDRFVVGERAPVQVQLGCQKKPYLCERIYLRISNREVTLDSPGVIRPAAEPLVIEGRLPALALDPGLHEIDLEFYLSGDGKSYTWTERRIVELLPPLHAALTVGIVPQTSDSVLIQLTAINNAAHPVNGQSEILIEGEWPLRPAAGHRFYLPERAGIDLRYSFAVRGRARPGPYRIQALIRGESIGVTRLGSSFFLPYEWLALGPLSPGDVAASEFRPDLPVDPFALYQGQWDLDARWGEMPLRRTLEGGIVDVGGFVWENVGGARPERSRSYAFTLFEVPAEIAVDLELLSPLPLRIWHNQGLVFDTESMGGRQAFSGRKPETRLNLDGWFHHLVPLHLFAGRNTLLVELEGPPEAQKFYALLREGPDLPLETMSNNLSALIEDFARLQEIQRKVMQGLIDANPPVRVTLEFQHDSARTIHVIGSFNTWSRLANPMEEIRPGFWRATLTLPEGTYSYRFLIDGTEEVIDPDAQTLMSDGYGGMHGVLQVSRK